MSLSKLLQSPRILDCTDPATQQALILEKGKSWYREHPQERAVIVSNLARFGLEPRETLVDKIIEGILLHYSEKVCGLCHTTQTFHQFLSESCDCTTALKQLESIRSNTPAVLLAISHFGAVELLAPALAAHATNLTVAMRFKTEELSCQARQRAGQMHESGLFGSIGFIEIGKPGTVAALEMAAVVRSGGILVSIFDEYTPYNKPVSLFGAQLMGGSGLDKLIAFSRVPLTTCAAFMVRTGANRYRLELDPVPDSHPAPIQALYDSLHKRLTGDLSQWYFLHEEIPFAGDSEQTEKKREI